MDWSRSSDERISTVLGNRLRRNVIPSEPSAILDIRMLPDEDVDAFYGKLADLIDDPQVTVVPEPIYRPAPYVPGTHFVSAPAQRMQGGVSYRRVENPHISAGDFL